MSDATTYPTPSLIARAAREWSALAGEPVTVQSIGGELYAFGSELACLRLAHKMRVGRAEYSPNCGSWTWCKDRQR